jgi:hypothetical protein
MAIKIGGTTVIDDNANITSSVGGFKTVGGVDITGSGNIEAGASTAVNGVGTYTLAYDTGMADGTTDSQAQWKVYKEGRTVAGSALRTRAAVSSMNNGQDKQATSTSGTNRSASVDDTGYSMVAVVTSDQTYSGSWRLMSPGANKTNRSSYISWTTIYTGLWVRYI